MWLASLVLVAALTLISLLSDGGNSHAFRHYQSVRLNHSLPRRLHHIRHPGESATQRTILTVEPTHLEKEFAPGAVGLSIEAEELTTRDLNTHQAPVALMRLLGPGVLRVGGNSVDHAWWTSDAERPPAWATSVITPADLVSLRELLEATGWRTILGVNLGHFDPTRAANEARIAHSILGGRLLGIEIGNEPNGYGIPSIGLRGPTYDITDYLNEVSAYSAAIHTVSRGIPLYGPEVGAPTSWLTTIGSAAQMPFAVLTAHYYPTSYSVPQGLCKGTSLPTALDLLAPRVRQEENVLVEMLVSAGQHARRPTRITETNTTHSCDASGAPDTGPVFASALWSFDWILRAASAGVVGLNFHGSFGGCTSITYSPLCAPRDTNGVHVGAGLEYYGLYAARQLEGGRFVPVDISGQNATENLAAYATVHPRGVITLAIENFATKGLASCLLEVPSYDKATSESLVGSSASATSGVTFGHASFNTVGVLRSTSTKVSGLGDRFRLTLAPTSAIVITLRR